MEGWRDGGREGGMEGERKEEGEESGREGERGFSHSISQAEQTQHHNTHLHTCIHSMYTVHVHTLCTLYMYMYLREGSDDLPVFSGQTWRSHSHSEGRVHTPVTACT